jgi:hypothetical protein
LPGPAYSQVFVRTNYDRLVQKAVTERRQIGLRGELAKLSDDVNHAIARHEDGFALLGPAFDRLVKTYTPKVAATLDASNPLASLKALASVAVTGRDKILENASREIVYISQDIAVQGTAVLLSAGPGSGKTTLLFLLVAARLNLGAPISILGHTVAPAPAGKFLVVIENEHSDESSARIIVKSCKLLGVDDKCLDRLIIISRKNVLLNSPVWADIVTLIASGLCSDVVIDTLARFAPGDANEEEAQVAVFAAVQAAIETAPSPETQPTYWIAAHSRKGGSGGIEDVGGSVQRAGQVDAVVTLTAHHVDGKIRHVEAKFPKVREKDADSWPDRVTYRIGKDSITVNGKDEVPSSLSLADQVLEHLKRTGPKTAGALAKLTNRNFKDVQDAITELFGRQLLTTTTLTIKGVERKGFGLRAPDEAPAAVDPDAFINNES